jgi:hypothetical protein
MMACSLPYYATTKVSAAKQLELVMGDKTATVIRIIS